jgi:hypothetical protein
MDHHCPWIYNCVGFNNCKYFFLLLLYATIDCHFIIWSMLWSVMKAVDSHTPFMEMFLLLFGETLAGFLGSVVTVFFSFHIWLMLRAMTTIEYCEKSMKKTAYDTSSYDRGYLGNVKATLGDEVWLWFLPLNPPTGTGLAYVTEDMRLLRDAEVGRNLRRRAHQWSPDQPQPGAAPSGGRRQTFRQTGSSPPGSEDSEGGESGDHQYQSDADRASATQSPRAPPEAGAQEAPQPEPPPPETRPPWERPPLLS